MAEPLSGLSDITEAIGKLDVEKIDMKQFEIFSSTVTTFSNAVSAAAGKKIAELETGELETGAVETGAEPAVNKTDDYGSPPLPPRQGEGKGKGKGEGEEVSDKEEEVVSDTEEVSDTEQEKPPPYVHNPRETGLPPSGDGETFARAPPPSLPPPPPPPPSKYLYAALLSPPPPLPPSGGGEPLEEGYSITRKHMKHSNHSNHSNNVTKHKKYKKHNKHNKQIKYSIHRSRRRKNNASLNHNINKRSINKKI